MLQIRGSWELNSGGLASVEILKFELHFCQKLHEHSMKMGYSGSSAYSSRRLGE